MRAGITLAMIVKNEEQKLPRCLNSVRGVADEIVIVDTGSTDRTLDIARTFKARIAQIEWPGAYDLARNEALKYVETEWILALDADEWLPAESARPIRQAIKRSDAFGFNLLMKEIGTESESLHVALPRLWRSRPMVPFVGIVHEHLDRRMLEDLGETRKEFTTDIVFLHDGYSEGRNAEKTKRYIELLREELRVRPGQPYYEVKLACSLWQAKSPDAKESLWFIGDRMLASDDDCEPELAYAAAFGPLFSSLQDQDLKTARTDKLIRLARGWFPTTPVVLWHVAEIEVRRGNLTSAMHALLEVEKMTETGDYDRRTPFQPGIVGMALWTNLGIVAQQLGRKDIARRNYERILRVDPTNHLAKQNIALL